ncbi:MAG: carbohydrate ABC transporter permease [Clostridia bacterium]|nr:carbohydrate ABC transporter permease [Clostridia bacterium]
MRKKPSALLIVLFVLMAFIATMYILMIVWAGFASLKDPWEFDDSALAFPKIWSFVNYASAFKSYTVKVPTPTGDVFVGPVRIIINTIFYAGGCAFLGTLVPCITSYVVAKYKFRVLKIYYVIVVVCLSIPIIGGTASQLRIAKSIGIYDTIWGIWLMRGYFIGSYFLIFYSSFMMIPNSFSEAAKIDGAGNFTILFKLVLPLISKTFTTILLILFVNYWNEYETPLMFTPSVPTLAVGLYKFAISASDEYGKTPIQLAGSMILFIPILIMYICLQDKLMGNISMGGIKE